MISESEVNFSMLRDAMASFEVSARIEPNEVIDLDRVAFPNSHRGVLDMKRQLVVGNRGMGKSFWSHALTNPAVRDQLGKSYAFPALSKTNAVLGFNASEKSSDITPTRVQIRSAYSDGNDPELIWRAVVYRAAKYIRTKAKPASLADTLALIKADTDAYAEELTTLDTLQTEAGSYALIIFDALDRLSDDWKSIRELTKGLLVTALGLQSFRSIRAKIFMRVDQFADPGLFLFPDSSKLRNDHVDLSWSPYELYGLLFFEILRNKSAASVLETLARQLDAFSALPLDGRLNAYITMQEALIAAIAGEFMGTSSKRGRVYTWVPLHLSDAANNCSPRTFLTAWKTAADHAPGPNKLAVDHLGLSEGVRRASNARLKELGEDYPWISLALAPLRRQFVPIDKLHLFELWRETGVIERIEQQAQAAGWLAPIQFEVDRTNDGLLRTMADIAVMEIRANGKVNVPDIFRVEAEILRKGGVAVPRKN